MCSEFHIDNINTLEFYSPPLLSDGSTFLVAAHDAHPKSKLKANLVCDGIADDVEILEALKSLPDSGGTVALTEGTFNLTNKISMPLGKSVRLIGQGVPTNDINKTTSRLNFVFSSFNNCIEFSTDKYPQAIENLVISGDDLKTQRGIALYASSQKCVRDVAIFNVTLGGLTLYGNSHSNLFVGVQCRLLDCHGIVSYRGSTANTFIHCFASRNSAMGVSDIYRGFNIQSTGDNFIGCVAEYYYRGFALGEGAQGITLTGIHCEYNDVGLYIGGSSGNEAKGNTISGGSITHDKNVNSPASVVITHALGNTIIGLNVGWNEAHLGYYISPEAIDNLIMGGWIETPQKIEDHGTRTTIIGIEESN